MLKVLCLLLGISSVNAKCQLVSTKSNFNLTEYVRDLS